MVGNDATLAGLAEARTGAARGAATALHLIVAVGIGGTLVVNGDPVTGSQGAAGEYGHVPFADPSMVCPCGARGCWDLTVDGRAIPEVDDLLSLSMDLWAAREGFTRIEPGLAGKLV